MNSQRGDNMRAGMSRRDAVGAAISAASITAYSSLFAEGPVSPGAESGEIPITGQAHPGLQPFDLMMTEFVRTHRVPGATLAVSRNSDVVYARGFGFADVESKRPVQPDSLFRIASVSKPITAVAVLQLMRELKGGLDRRVFDVLPAADWLQLNHDKRLSTITIRQLLQHTGGWDRDKSFDPIGRPHQIAEFAKHPLPVGPDDVVRYTLSLPLDFDPGTRYAYSNTGYLLLGRLIEHLGKQRYEDYVQQHVLKPAGVTQMQLGRSSKQELAKNEVHYYDSKHREGPAVNGPQLGIIVPLVYGGENFEAFEAHGGWIGSAIDLVKFASSFDHPASSKLLKPNEIATMWGRPAGLAGKAANGKPRDVYYGCGWDVRPVKNGKNGKPANTWHNGMIAGTSALLVRRHDGLNWAALFNTDSDHEDKVLSGLVDPLIHHAADAVLKWPTS